MSLDGQSRALATAAVLSAMALVVLDAGITNVALPTISRALAIAPAQAILVTSAYQLALLMGLLPAAHAARRIGSRRLFKLGICIFTAASVLAGMSWSFPMLVAARFLQGLGGAAILALGIPLLRAALGPERLGSAIAWNALNVALCAAAGPALGALLLTIAGWPVLFLVNLPVGILAVAAAARLPERRHGDAKIDVVSTLLHAGSAALLFVACEALQANTALAALAAAAGLGGAALLVRRELPKAAPLLPLDLLRAQPFRLAVLSSICCFVAQSAGLLALPFLLQLDLDQSALATGAVMACWPLAVALTSPLSNRLSDRFDSGALCAVGAGLLGAGLSGAALIGESAASVAICAALCGVGFGLFQVPSNRTLFLAAPPHRSEAAGGMQGTARLAGQTLGAVLVARLFAAAADGAAPKIVFAVAACFAIGAMLISARRASAEGRAAIICEA